MGIIANQCMVKKGNENAKLISEEADLKVGEASKIRGLYRITNEIPETEKRGRTANQARSREGLERME